MEYGNNMSVVKSERTTSKFEYFTLGIKIHDMIYTLAMQDFGFKSKTKDFYAFVRKLEMDEDDRKEFFKLCEKYEINVEADFPSWMLEHLREKVLEYDDEFLENLVSANTVYSNSVFEFNLKRGYTWECISRLQLLLQYFQSIIRMIPIKPERKEKYIVYTEMMDEEMELLRGWKKRCNKIFPQAYKKDMERNNRAVEKINNYADSKATNLIPSNIIIDTASISIDPATSYSSAKKIEEIEQSSMDSTQAINPFHAVRNPFSEVMNPFHSVA